MKQHLISLPHHPKRVIIISLILALSIGIFGYLKINKKVQNPSIKDNSTMNENISSNSSPMGLTLGFLSSGRVKSISVKAGDNVKKGEVLATIDADNEDGGLIQAEAAYEVAKANYQKIINGATKTAVDIAKTSVNTAEVNLNGISKQQEVLVNNALRSLLNSSLEAQSVSDNEAHDSPTISGTYECKNEGSYDLQIYSSSGGYSLNYSGLENGTLFLTDVPRPLGDCGLLLAFDKTKTPQAGAKFNIQIPNKNAANYSSNNNAYKLALQNKEQAISGAQAALNQAQAAFESVVTNARPEDVAIAEAEVERAHGALIANPTYGNMIISAPTNGTVTAIYISLGQTIKPNSGAIGFLAASNQN